MLTNAGLPPGEMFAGAEGLKKGAGNSTGSDPFSALEASQEGLSKTSAQLQTGYPRADSRAARRITRSSRSLSLCRAQKQH